MAQYPLLRALFFFFNMALWAIPRYWGHAPAPQEPPTHPHVSQSTSPARAAPFGGHAVHMHAARATHHPEAHDFKTSSSRRSVGHFNQPPPSGAPKCCRRPLRSQTCGWIMMVIKWCAGNKMLVVLCVCCLLTTTRHSAPSASRSSCVRASSSPAARAPRSSCTT